MALRRGPRGQFWCVHTLKSVEGWTKDDWVTSSRQPEESNLYLLWLIASFYAVLFSKMLPKQKCLTWDKEFEPSKYPIVMMASWKILIFELIFCRIRYVLLVSSSGSFISWFCACSEPNRKRQFSHWFPCSKPFYCDRSVWDKVAKLRLVMSIKPRFFLTQNECMQSLQWHL